MITLRKQHRRYEKYRDSGIEYLDKIPVNWDVKQTKYLKENFYKSFADGDWVESKDQVESGDYKLLQLKNISENRIIEPIDKEITQEFFLKNNCRKLRNRDLLIARIPEPILRTALFDEGLGNCVSIVDVAILNPVESCEPKYLSFLLNSHALRQEGVSLLAGSTRQRISRNKIGNLKLCIPPTSTQSSIASYLDEKCALINSIIEKKQRQLELLKEKRAAIINRAVTRGIDESVEMKESGVEWIGEVPKGWEIAPLKWFISVRSGDFLSNDLFSDSGKFPVIGGNGEMGRTTLCNRTEVTIAIGRVGAKCGNVHLVKGKSWVTDNALMLTKLREFDLRYLAEILRFRNFNEDANKSAQPLISGNTIKNIKVPIPPLDEQKKIMNYIDTESSKNEKLHNTLSVSLSLLSEYKTSLIAHAVTGRIKLT